MQGYGSMKPGELRQLIRDKRITCHTSGMAAGYAQANLVILPNEYADDFMEYTRLNPAPCPVLEVLRHTPYTRIMADGANILTDIPEYRVYRYGKLCDVCSDVSGIWQEDMTGFLIGCSFSFEEALIKSGIEMRHIAMNRNVPMYKTNIMTLPYGVFSGPTVCSMRPMTMQQAMLAARITAAMPNVHGAPIHIGSPDKLGIADIMKPDYGDPVDIRSGEVCVFWPCGVTPQAAIENAKPPLVITHSPGHMFITDILNSELNGVLEAQKKAI